MIRTKSPPVPSRASSVRPDPAPAHCGQPSARPAAAIDFCTLWPTAKQVLQFLATVPQLRWIIPIVIVALSAAAAMLAEAFRQPGERMPIAGLGMLS